MHTYIYTYTCIYIYIVAPPAAARGLKNEAMPFCCCDTSLTGTAQSAPSYPSCGRAEHTQKV